MSAVYVQDNLKLQVSTPLGPNKLLLRAFRGEEYISGLFQFNLEMVSEDSALDFQAIVGKSVTVTLSLADGAKHYVNGIVGRFIQEETNARLTRYHAEIHPWLWLLTKTADCRIFQNQSTPEIIKAVFSDLGFTDFRDDLKGTYEAREYCVQYNETAFNFVSRLMEDEGIFYFFEHSDGVHTLVLGDDADVHQMCPGLEQKAVRFKQSLVDHTQDLAITRCLVEEQVVSDKSALDDFNFETPSTDLIVEETAGTGKLRVYEYPGGFLTKSSGEGRAKIRLDAFEQPKKLIKGEGFVRAFTAGHKFTLKDHYRGDVNQDYVLCSVVHAVTQENYTNSFEAFPASVVFRPARVTPRPIISGTQTAKVVGKSGEEIWTDKYGRIKVQFHWDQKGQNDETSSCWVRVDYGWAGKNWGGIFLPRIGQEVVVSYLEGDPDRPLVTGAVYNAEQTVPYTLPDEQTKSTVKTNTSKGGNGYNEIRFEDKKDSEELYFHAQKDQNIVVEHDRTKKVLNNETNTIKQDRSTTIEEGNDTYVVSKGNRTFQVNTGNETYEVKGTRDVTVTGDETHTDKANFTQKVTGNYELKVTGNLTIDVTGSVTIKSGQSMTHEAQMSMTNKAGMSLTNEAQIGITNKGQAQNNVESGGITTIKGALVKIN
ncbi:MAG TPA: type VI secretion system tip protein TssI/VgrG [Pyrinomonadaceae bacterium]|nr:type VI secretion system tip protein TssI/VgrG [Pyrinomonadaceae bacterium]